MFFSLFGIIQPAQNEEEANNQILKTHQILFCDNFNSFSNSYAAAAAGIFEADDIEEFAKTFQENIIQFCKEYKEKCENVQNY